MNLVWCGDLSVQSLCAVAPSADASTSKSEKSLECGDFMQQVVVPNVKYRKLGPAAQGPTTGVNRIAWSAWLGHICSLIQAAQKQIRVAEIREHANCSLGRQPCRATAVKAASDEACTSKATKC